MKGVGPALKGPLRLLAHRDLGLEEREEKRMQCFFLSCFKLVTERFTKGVIKEKRALFSCYSGYSRVVLLSWHLSATCFSFIPVFGKYFMVTKKKRKEKHRL